MRKLYPTPIHPIEESASDAETISRGHIPDRWRVEVERLGQRIARRSVLATPYLAEELIAAGLVTLWRAADGFDPSRGTPFEHYARRSIRNAMLSELRALENPTSRAMTVPLDDDGVPLQVLSSPADGPERTCERNELRETVSIWIGTCDAPLQEVFALLYEEEMTQREAAAEMGVSQPRVSQHHTRLITNAKEALAGLAAA